MTPWQMQGDLAHTYYHGNTIADSTVYSHV